MRKAKLWKFAQTGHEHKAMWDNGAEGEKNPVGNTSPAGDDMKGDRQWT